MRHRDVWGVGDLAKRKLLPALYDLAIHACLAPRFKLLGFARTEMGDDQFRKEAGRVLPAWMAAVKGQDFMNQFITSGELRRCRESYRVSRSGWKS